MSITRTRDNALENLEDIASLHGLLDSLTDAVCLTGLNGQIIWANQAEQKLLGYSLNELVGQPLAKFHADDTVINKLYNEFLRNPAAYNNQLELTARLVAKDGRVINVRKSVRAVCRDNRLSHFQCISSELKDGKSTQLDDALSRMQERYDALLDQVASIVWCSDSDGRFVVRQKSWEEYTGQSFIEYENFGWLNVIHVDDRGTLDKAWRNARATNGRYAVEIRFWNQNEGCFRYCRVNGRPLLDRDGEVREWIGTITDIDSEKRAEKNRSRLVSIVNSSSDAIIGKNSDAIITEWNKAAETLFGYKENEIIGKHASILLPPNRKEEVGMIHDRLRKGETFRLESVRLRKDGSSVPLSLSYSPVVSKNGEMIGTAIIARDISERRAASEKIKSLNTELSRRVEELQKVLDVASVGVVVAHNADCTDVSLNGALRESLGITSDREFVADSVRYLVQGKEIDDTDLPLVVAAREGVQLTNVELDVLRHDGRLVNFLQSAAPLFDDCGNVRGSVGVFIDITDQRRVEEGLRKNAQQVRKILDNLYTYVCVLSPCGTMLEVNRALLERSRIEAADVLNRKFESTFWWSYSPSVKRRIKAAIDKAASGKNVRFDVAMRVSDGELVTVDFMIAPLFDDEGKVSYLVPSAVDVSEQKKMESRLRVTEKEFREFAEAIPQVMWAADASGNPIYFDRSSHQGPGARVKTSMVSNSWIARIHKDDRALFEAGWKKAVSSGEHVRCEYRLKDRSGEYRTHIGEIIPIKDLAGKIKRWIGTSTDIDDLKKVSEQLKIAKDEAEKINQAKTLFLGKMSHELRTPLGSIIGFTDLVESTGGLNYQQEQALETIRRNGSLLLQIIDDLLDLSKIEAGKLTVAKEECSLVQMLRDIRSVMALEAKRKNVKFIMEGVSSLPQKIIGDINRIKQVLLNVTGNAVKFTEPNGEVRLSAKFVNGNSAVGQCDAVEFRVIDTGIGMTQDQVDKLFKVFSQGDDKVFKKFGGSGLGLELARSIARAMGGDVNLVKTELGVGSEFLITIPTGSLKNTSLVSLNEALSISELTNADRGKSISPQIEQKTKGYKALNGKRVLLAEDSAELQALAKFYLEHNGAKVDVVDNGSAAIEKALNSDFDVILMDLEMPEVDGRDATWILRTKGFDRPILALSAHALEDERNRCSEIGFTDYLTKPISHTQLTNHILRYTKTTEKKSPKR